MKNLKTSFAASTRSLEDLFTRTRDVPVPVSLTRMHFSKAYNVGGLFTDGESKNVLMEKKGPELGRREAPWNSNIANKELRGTVRGSRDIMWVAEENFARMSSANFRDISSLWGRLMSDDNLNIHQMG
jgi:hypothetical protein